MLKNLFNEIKKMLKDDYKFLIVLGIIVVSMLIPVPYYIVAGGGTVEINNRIKIDQEYDTKGSFNFAYVKELKGTTLTYLYGKVFNKELIKKSDAKLENQTTKDYEKMNYMYLEQSITNATFAAYNLAGKEISVIKNELKVMYIAEKADTNIKSGDIILKVDGVTINSLLEYKSVLATKELNSKLNILVKRDNKEVNCYANLYMLDDRNVLGLLIYEEQTFKTNPDIKYNSKSHESGPSGGLMIALNIYNKLTPDDLTKGKKITGTGAIDNLGNVLEIGGIAYKFNGAVKAKSDIFIAPAGINYQEVVELKKKNNYNIIIIEAKTLEQVVNDLKNL